MMRRCLLLALLTVALSDGAASAERTQPNVLFIAIDDLNDWVGVLGGHAGVRTPNIDRLAQRGVLFTNAHCSAPVCNASRTSLLTGARPSTSGIYGNAEDWRISENLEGVVTLPRHFKASGYETLGTGKLFHAHTFNELALSGFPDTEAWDAYFPSLTQQMPAEPIPDGWPVHTSPDLFYRGHFDWGPVDVDEAEMADAQVVAWAAGQLARRHDRPVFLSVGIYRPHTPWYLTRAWFDRVSADRATLPPVQADDLDDVPPAGQKRAKRKWHAWLVEHGEWEGAVQAYIASIEYADAMVGRLLDALRRGPLCRNTVVVLWSDHGYHLGEKESWEKQALWEDTTHVPLIVVDPRIRRRGARCDQPVSLLDVYPTLVDLCRLAPRPGLEGESLVPLLCCPGRETGRAVVTTYGKDNHAIRSARYRYIRYADGSEELYDHLHDPHEWTNLASRPDLAPVKQALATWIPRINVERSALGDPEMGRCDPPAEVSR